MSNNVSLLSLLSGFYQVNKSILTRMCLFSLKRFKKIGLPSFKINLLCSFHKTVMFRHLHNVGDRSSYWQSSHQCWSFSNREDNVQLLDVFLVTSLILCTIRPMLLLQNMVFCIYLYRNRFPNLENPVCILLNTFLKCLWV